MRANKVRFILAALVVGLLGWGIACNLGAKAPVGGEIRIYNWKDYFAPNTLDDFASETGIRVSLDEFDDEQAMLSVIESDPSRYDVIFASDLMIADMVDLRLLAELDRKDLPNLANIDPAFLDQSWDPGNKYSVPYTWGSTGVVYSKNNVQTSERRWSLLWDPKLQRRVALLNDPFVVLGLALKSLGHPMNSKDPTQVQRATDLLKSYEEHITGFLEPTEIKEKMVSGELWAAQIYSGDAAAIMAENPDLEFFIPIEGSDLWIDSIAVTRSAPNKRAAEMFLDYILRPKVQAEISKYTGYATPNKAALQQGLVAREVLDNGVSYPPRDRLERWTQLDAQRRTLWNMAWAEIQK